MPEKDRTQQSSREALLCVPAGNWHIIPQKVPLSNPPQTSFQPETSSDNRGLSLFFSLSLSLSLDVNTQTAETLKLVYQQVVVPLIVRLVKHSKVETGKNRERVTLVSQKGTCHARCEITSSTLEKNKTNMTTGAVCSSAR